MAPPEQLPPPTATPEAIRDKADEILARPEFRQPPKSIYERVVDWLAERLEEVISALFSGGRTSLVAWVALAVVAAVIVLLVARIVLSVRPSPEVSRGISVVTERRRPPADWEREALAHAAEGQWREALRCRYRALVARLATMGAVDEVPGRTAGEYRMEVRRTRPEASPPFGDATDLFERAWYGHRPTGPEDEEHFRRLAGMVVDESARG